MRRGYADTPEGQMHYVEEGSGPPVLLLHHTPRSWTFWRRVIPLLSPRHRVVAMDTLGFGASDPPKSGANAHDYAENVAHFMDAVGIEQAHVAGAMTGSRIAMELAIGWPERVRSLTVMGFPLFASQVETDQRMAETTREHMGAPEPDGSHVLKVWRYVLGNLAVRDFESPYTPGVYVPGEATQSPIAQLTEAEQEYLRDWLVDELRVGAHWWSTAVSVYSEDARPRLPLVTPPVLALGLRGRGFPAYLGAERAAEVAKLAPDGRTMTIDGADADSRVATFHSKDLAAAMLVFWKGLR